LKKDRVEFLLQAQNLGADRRLLDAIWHLARCPADAAVFRDVIKKLEVVNVHRASIDRIDPSQILIN
jgi:hypothetical protein